MNRAGRVAQHVRHVRHASQLAAEPVLGEVSTVRTGQTAVVSLTRPTKLNSLNLNMIRELRATYDKIVAEGAGCVLLKGEGRAFCAGGDVAAIQQQVEQGKVDGLPVDFFYEEYQLVEIIATLLGKHKIPQVSLWNGIVMGGGVGLSVHAPFRVCTEKTVFAMPETKIGLFPDVGATYALPRLPGGLPVALMLGLAGTRLKAADCLWAGLATHFIASDKLPAVEEQLAQAHGFDDVKRCLDTFCSHPDQSSATLAQVEASIQKCFSADSPAAILKSLDSEGSEWAAQTAKTLREMSPLSICVSHRAMVEAAKDSCSLQEALVKEYRLSQYCAQRDVPRSDFQRGVRAVLIAKPAEVPQYSHASVEDVPAALVQEFFEPLPQGHPRGELAL
eukprot:CAMPEP_0204278040 /NCGR_PEP_ID=MMETSP0468-20130131/29642_1 /ASSEMBLY_ACC=CAM_ASM_000383 /TAXON_ID=2969 /ORGANISM="Oxyrrhis marina" /LENGTH=389 /DNA_ID=CAMNT_0051254899 /DNA_START=20 /DNA_END=1189 /DNA_ORIENTATION=+